MLNTVKKKSRLAKLLVLPKEALFRHHGFCPVMIGGMPFYGNTQNLKFWTAVNEGNWESQTFNILSTFLTSESTYCDIGAWIGPTVLYAARKCRKVYCFEPDRISYEYLLSNIRRNRLENVVPFNLAITNRDGLTKIGTFGKTFGRSKSTLLNGHAPGAMEIPALSWRTATRLFDLGTIDFLKIDIEGAEYDLIPHLSQCLTEKNPPFTSRCTHNF